MNKTKSVFSDYRLASPIYRIFFINIFSLSFLGLLFLIIFQLREKNDYYIFIFVPALFCLFLFLFLNIYGLYIKTLPMSILYAFGFVLFYIYLSYNFIEIVLVFHLILVFFFTFNELLLYNRFNGYCTNSVKQIKKGIIYLKKFVETYENYIKILQFQNIDVNDKRNLLNNARQILSNLEDALGEMYANPLFNTMPLNEFKSFLTNSRKRVGAIFSTVLTKFPEKAQRNLWNGINEFREKIDNIKARIKRGKYCRVLNMVKRPELEKMNATFSMVIKSMLLFGFVMILLIEFLDNIYSASYLWNWMGEEFSPLVFDLTSVILVIILIVVGLLTPKKLFKCLIKIKKLLGGQKIKIEEKQEESKIDIKDIKEKKREEGLNLLRKARASNDIKERMRYLEKALEIFSEIGDLNLYHMTIRLMGQ